MRNVQGVTTTWKEFEEAVKRQFIPPNYEPSVMDKLKQCKKEGSATDYVKEFRRLILALPHLSEREKWEHFPMD